MTARDTLRWGDQQGLSWKTPATAPSSPIALGTTRQLVQAHWRWPLSWTLLLVMNPMLPAAEAGTFAVNFAFAVGVGQGTTNFAWSYTFAPGVGGLYTSITEQRFVPAQDLQIIASVVGAPTVTSAAESFVLGAYCAPFTEPHAMTHVLERITGDGHPDEPAERWIPAGFGVQPVRYQR